MATDLRNFRDFAVWRPTGDAASCAFGLGGPIVGARLSDRRLRLAKRLAAASKRDRLCAPAALIAVVGAWAMLPAHAGGEQFVPQPEMKAVTETPAPTNPPTAELVRANRNVNPGGQSAAAAPKPAAPLPSKPWPQPTDARLAWR
jgi:hypothetical protein